MLRDVFAHALSQWRQAAFDSIQLAAPNRLRFSQAFLLGCGLLRGFSRFERIVQFAEIFDEIVPARPRFLRQTVEAAVRPVLCPCELRHVVVTETIVAQRTPRVECQSDLRLDADVALRPRMSHEGY